MRAIVIVGLPGSGKTHRANAEYVPQGFALIDDPLPHNGGFLDLYNHAIMGDSVVLCDANLCFPHERKACETALATHGYDVSWEFFDNNPSAARDNLNRRQGSGDPRVAHVEFVSKHYIIPEDTETLPVWQPSQNPGAESLRWS